MTSGRFTVCEKNGEWAMALRWAAGNLPLRVYETRSLSDCRQELLQFPASFLALEATIANIDGVLQLVAEINRSHTCARAVVLSERKLKPWEHLLREAGALHVAFSPRRLDAIARMAYRHLPAMIHPDVSLPDSIRSRIPWPAE